MAANNGIDPRFPAGQYGETTVQIDDVKLSLEGINLMLNNGFRESQEIFDKFKTYSPLMSSGWSFVTFMNALMTYEDDKLDAAMEALKETEKLCSSKSGGFMKSFKTKVFKGSAPGKLSSEDRLQRRILLADCQLYMAMLIFSRHEMTGILRGGWLVRKGYKIYEKTYEEISNIYKSRGQEMLANPGMVEKNGEATPMDPPEGVDGDIDEEIFEATSGDFNDLSDDALSRLRGGVSFGYGLLQLVISLMPPSVLKVVNLLGFCGDRQFGLACIKQASYSRDMKAPLAVLTLLWYHTVVRPFFGLQSSTKEDCVKEALKILEENKPKYPKSALMSFYRGRVLKLQGKLDEALERYNIALEECAQQREIQLICLYEIGWGNLMKMNWEESLLAFARLKEESKWSQSYYAFLTAMTQGALGQVETAQEIFREVPTLSKRRNNQLEQYVTRKALKFKKTPPTQTESTLMAIEVLYLWKALPECSEDILISMLKECEKADNEKNKKAIVTLLKGAIHKDLGNKNVAKQFFEGVLNIQPSKNQEMHAFPYACFELGSLMLEDEVTAAVGKSFILKAKESYKDYDFEQRLHVRIHTTLQQIRI